MSLMSFKKICDEGTDVVCSIVASARTTFSLSGVVSPAAAAASKLEANEFVLQRDNPCSQRTGLSRQVVCVCSHLPHVAYE